MPSVFSHLRSSFGRRLLLLFALCIVVPGALFGYLSLRQVEEKFHQETMRRMRLKSREIGMSIHGGLSSIETEVEFLAGILGDGTTPSLRRSSDLGWLFHNRPLLGMTRFFHASPLRTETLYGNPCPPPPQTSAARSHLASGKGLLYLQQNPGVPPRLFLAHAIRGKAPERELLVCEVNPDFLWGRVRDALPPVTEVAVLPPDGAPLFQTQPMPVEVLGRIEQDRRKGPAGNFEWGQGSGTLLFDHAAIFLKPAFFSDEWTVLVTQPRSEAFAAAKRYTRVLFLSITLVVLIAGLFAHVQIRRSVAPLALLKEGTQRISGGDFDSRVVIGSGDEFEELAGSFNAMAGHLGREFRNQAEMGRIVQTILGETAKEKIVEVLLDNVAVIVPCDCVGLSLVEPSVVKNAAITYIREDASVVPSVTGKTILPLCADEIRRMISAGDGVLSVQGPDFGHFLSRWRGARPASFLLAPLVFSGDLAGVLILGYRNLQDPAREILVRIRQIADQAAIALSRAHLLEELSQNDLGTLMALARTVDANSSWTAGHSERVTRLSMEIGRELGLPSHDIDLLRRGGLLHDIGKLGVPPTILDKPGKLTEEEITVMQRHPGKGAEILEPIPNLQKVLPMVSQHHERFDGKGYPKGLSGEYISLHARILSLADVADALLSDRPYRPSWSREKVLVYVRENSGLHFDPTVVEAYLRMEAGRREAPHAELAATGT
ncbi:MAG: HD domain-containing protein [Deltaproteobacteria bacterium]|nr:HD domain-containing protein [Deltaproteobacteria bacterium]